jgi:deazaflavin-dependent oxidoreductase (nitroreductase family)
MWYNPIMAWLLRSPLHGFVSNSMMLITVAGRKSGKEYTVPVNYVRDDNVLLATSYRRRTWWRNLRGGVAVTVRLAGQDHQGIAQVVEDDEGVAAHLLAYLHKAPHIAKYLQVRLDPDGQPNREEVARAARERVMVRVQLD